MYLVLFLLSALGHLFHSSSVFAKENCVLYTNVFIENRFDKRQSVTILAEVADEPDERAIGLMNRTKIGKNKGMLFVYHVPSAPQFWMKNTLISLDILFSSYDGRIIKIFKNVPKMTEKKITAGDGVSFVLEINSGLVEKLEIDASWIMNFTDFFETTKPFC
tara:strand:+ start:1969 stop:2454 length:486 start_codon:yes stop_codon:yes gene_type:complete